MPTTNARKLAQAAWDRWSNEGQSTDPVAIIADAIQSAEASVRAECEAQRKIVHEYRDLLANAQRDAESILKPYLTTAGVFGITPDHRFREVDQLPMKLAEAIAAALAAGNVGDIPGN